MFVALGCVGFIASSPAMAQTAEQEGVLGGVTVTDTAIAEDTPKVEEAELPKYTRPLLDTPQTITVISNQTIRKQNLLTLRDVLATVPGITFGAGEGGGGYGDSINLRGQSANNDITIDGVRDAAQYSRTDPFNIEQIEVINGANSVYGGAGSIGGTVNLVTKRPGAQDLTVLEAGIGTDDYYRATVDTNMRVAENVAVRLNAMYHENDVPGRDFDSYERWGVAPAVKFGLEGPTSLTLLYTHQEDDNVPQYGVPYYKNAFHDGPLPGLPDFGYYGYKNVDYQEQQVDQATAILEHEFSDFVSVRNLSRWQRVEQNLVVNPPQGPNICLEDGTLPGSGAACGAGQVPGTYYPGGPRGTSRFSVNKTLYNQTDFTFDVGLLGLEHTLVLGGSWLKEEYGLDSGNSQRNPGGATPNPALDPIDLSDPDAIYTGPINFIRTAHQEGELTNTAFYLFDAIKLSDQFEVNGGLRYEVNDAQFRQDAVATSGTVTRGAVQDAEDGLFSYRVGLVYKPADNASVYAAFGNSTNPVATAVRSGCGLADEGNLFNDPCQAKPEKTVNYEIGGKIDLADGALQLTAALFRNERTNYRVASNDPSIGDLPVTDGRNRVDGIALGATGNITPDWSLFANYTYLDSEVLQSISDFQQDAGALDPQAGRPLTNTPKHSGSLFTTYMLPFGLQLGYGLTYQGSFYLNNAQNAAGNAVFYKADDYMTHRAFASYAFGNGLTAQLNIQNLTKERYFTNIRNNGWALPGEGRAARLSLFYSF